VNSSGSNRYFPSAQYPDQLWCPPDPLSSVYWTLFLQEFSSKCVKRTANLHLETRLEFIELYLQSSISLPGVILNYAWGCDLLLEHNPFSYWQTRNHSTCMITPTHQCQIPIKHTCAFYFIRQIPVQFMKECNVSIM